MKNNSVKINIIYQMLYEVLALALPLITSPYVSRVLGAEKIGIYSYTYSIATYFGIFSMLGVKNHGNREIAKARNDIGKVSSTFSNIYLLQLGMASVMVVLYIAYCCLCSEYKAFAFIQLVYVLSYMLDINWLYFGLELFKQTSIRNMIIKILAFLATILFVRTPNDLWKYCFILAGSALLSELILWIFVPKYIIFCRPNWKEVRKNIKPMLVLFVPILATSIYNFMDKIMVGNMSTKIQLGFYENAEKITNCVKTVILSIGTVMMPRMSFLISTKEEEKAEKYMNLSIELIMFLAFGFSFGVAVVSKEFSPLYWGKEFSGCYILLMGLCCALPFSAFGNFIRTQYMIPNNLDLQYILATFLSAVLNALFNYILIPKYGALGAVFGTIIAEGSLCIIQFLFVQKEKNLIPYLRRSIPYFIIGLVMFISVEKMAKNFELLEFRFIYKVFIGFCIYIFLTLVYLGMMHRDAIEFIRKRRNK